jgi:pilus assembly protein CpaE
VGMAGSGAEGIAMAKELHPDVIIMDINMPGADGLQITTQIVNMLPETGIIIMTAQDDPSYMRLAMNAGAKAFLTKPSSPDELYNNVRAVYARARAPMLQQTSSHQPVATTANKDTEIRAGNVIVVYSPQGGAGCTTIATNMASALMRDNVRVLLVDANLQFGDVGVFLNLVARSTLLDLVEDVDDMDIDYFENVVTTHNSGLKVLMGPARPELAEKVIADPGALTKILGKIRTNYDFIIVDTSLHLDEMALSLMDAATRVLLVSTPSLTAVKNARFVLDLFDQLGYDLNKTMLVLNQVSEDQNIKKLFISTDKVGVFLKRPIAAMIPTDQYLMLDAIRRGIPAVALERDHHKSPVKELLGLAESLFADLMPLPQEEPPSQPGQKTFAKTGFRKRAKIS